MSLIDIDTVALDSKEGVAARVREVGPSDVTHVHVPASAIPDGVSLYERMEPIYAAGRQAMADLGADLYDDWTPTEHYGYGINWQWIHLGDGRRICLTWIG